MRLKDLSAEWLIKTHFFGIYMTDPDGTVFLPNPQNLAQRLETVVIDQAIREAVATLEDLLDVNIRHKEHIVETHDFDKDMWEQYGMVNVRSYPVTKVHSLRIQYGENGPTIWEVPSQLIQMGGEGSQFGMVRILPMWGVASNYDPAYSMLFPGVLRSHTAPSLIRVEYDAGMDGMTEPTTNAFSDLDDALIRAIGLKASIHPFNVLGDIVLGAGIAGISASVDGVSQSISTTISAENAAYSARIIMHRRELYGEMGQPGLIETLRKTWRRPSLILL